MKTKLSGILTLLLAFFVQVTFAQDKTVSGTVSDDSGMPVAGVNIIVQGTSTGTQSDFDGNFSIMVDEGATLTFSYVGYTTESRTVGSSNTINVTLGEDVAQLEQVVIKFEDTAIRSPYDGLVVKQYAKQGEFINPISASLNSVISLAKG